MLKNSNGTCCPQSLEFTNGISKSKCLVTKTSVEPDCLQKIIGNRLFVIKPNIASYKLVYVHCFDIVLSFNVAYFSKKSSKSGKIRFIVDDKKGCGFADDSVELNYHIVNLEKSSMIPVKFSSKRAEKLAFADARWKVLMAKYKKPAELSTDSINEFFRPYYQVDFAYSKKTYERWVAADEYTNFFSYV